MGKGKKSLVVAFDKQGPDTLGEGYTWCPKCQAAFEGEVCPGCSPGIDAVVEPQPGAQLDPPPDHPAPEAAGAVFTDGDIVVLNSGGPDMTVRGIEVDGKRLCEWEQGGKMVSEFFGCKTIHKIPPVTQSEVTEPALKNLNDLQEAVKAAELDVKTRNTTESLKCVLTDDEIRQYGIAQARANAEIATAEEELQSVKSQYKSRVDAATAIRNDMAKRINNGYEFRQVDCVERWDYGSNGITVRRTDTYEVVSRRTMSRDEMQRKLF